ncbi:hypothetical protein D0Z00_001977 [Geotrichum galactomycetum]|uniref:Uncharacterized protein n=1 Tax=Geotrichum galactomycetum TaxID=27317 RepID=A0ACB6V5H5_9ASCO|nr:hypothetical protein D0Z00_001977 [Geotrichum candidum]
MSRNGSSQALLTTHDEQDFDDDVIDLQTEAGELASRSMLAAASESQAGIASNIFHIGGITSGGLAPGAGLGEHDARLNEGASSRRYFYSKDDPEANITSHNTRVNSGTAVPITAKDGPYIDGRQSEGDIPMALLHHKLDEYASTQEERERLRREEGHVDEVAHEFAEHLVRSHSRYLGSRPPSPDQSGLTLSSRAFFDSAPDLIDLGETKPGGDTGNVNNNTNNVNSDDNSKNQENNANNGSGGDNGGGNSDKNETLLIENSSTDDNQNGTTRDEDYVPPPSHVRKGILGSLFMLYGTSHKHSSHQDSSNPPSGASTPRKSFGYENQHHHQSKSVTDLASLKHKSLFKLHKSRSANASTTSLNDLVSSSAASISSTLKVPLDGPKKPSRPKPYRMTSGLDVRKAKKERERKKREEQQRLDITLHIAEVLQRQRFILRLCRALMMFGAPTHRLEEYMMMTSRALEIDGQFLYIPGCMMVSFDDSSTHTSEMQLVRCVQGVNLYKLNETHTIYKDVIHGNLRIDQALEQLEEQFTSKNLYPPWLCVLFFGFASVAVGPFAFGGRWHDMPISFLLGSSVGVLQTVVAPRSTLYNNVFEVTASIAVSFLARAFGSIGSKQDIFCFAAIAQSALALILPGYIILCGSLEMQSRNIVAGSVRMFYAIIYSLLLGFGITLGAVIYGWIDGNATSETTCPHPLNPWWRTLFVPMFTLGLALVNQAHWRQIPVMVVISGAGYTATYFSGLRLANAAELTSALGALVIGVLGNVYSRVGHGLAFVAMLPAIFVQVPSGVASQGSLVAGIDNANNIINNKTTDATSRADGFTYSTVMNLGITMVQVSIGITVGLFVATLVIYPFGKKRSGLFTF